MRRNELFTPIKHHKYVADEKISPFAIQNHSSAISIPMQILKKIRQEILKLETGNEALMDGRTDTLMVLYIRLVNVSVERYKDKKTYNQVKLFLITVNI